MRRQITGSVRAGESTIRIAERLLDIDNPIVELPRYAEELQDAARFAHHAKDPNLYQKAVDKYIGQIRRLGEKGGRAGPYTVRSAAQQLVKDLKKAKPEQIDKVVDRYILDRARYQARLVTRHEVNEAYRDSYRASTDTKDYVVGYRWELSPSHPVPDICELYANQDLDGLGPGGYKVGNIPATPHPACMCVQTAIIDRKHFKRKLARQNGEKEPAKPWLSGKKETAEQWLKSIPESKRLEILGPTRMKLLEKGRHVTDKNGALIPVYKLLGQPKPKLSRGPSIKAKPIIKRDRENMVRPFPKVPPV